MQPSIVYENPDFLIINKPSGLLTHPANRQDKSDSVVGWLLKKYPEIAKVQDQYGKDVGEWTDLRPGIVHRLDRDTSGLLLVAKNQQTFDYFKKLFQEKKIKKTYLALVHGHLKNKTGVIESPIGKIGSKQTVQTYGKHRLKEKPAVTEYKVIENYTLNANRYTLVKVSPLTGRTHQIRVHLKSIGHPIVCDPLYAGKRAVCPPELAQHQFAQGQTGAGRGRMFLHAQKLAFISPNGEAIAVEVDLPNNLAEFLKSLQES